jgi:hypothetical protein
MASDNLSPNGIKVLRATAGLVVRTLFDGRTAEQSFATAAARDEYMARARRLGAIVEIVSPIEAS